MLEQLLRSKAEVKILGIVLFEEGLHLRGISRKANVSPFETKKELDNLVSLGVLTSEKKGNMVLFHSNEKCPFLSDLKQLYLKTEGIASELKTDFEKIKNVQFAFIYGSMASGKDMIGSDLDLMVVGSIEEQKLAEYVMKLQKKFKREINFILWTQNEFQKKLTEKSAFVKTLLNGKKIWLAGDEDEFIRITER